MKDDWQGQLREFLADVETQAWAYNGILAKLETLDEGYYHMPVGIVYVSHTVH
jgi:hypothetical protein